MLEIFIHTLALVEDLKSAKLQHLVLLPNTVAANLRSVSERSDIPKCGTTSHNDTGLCVKVHPDDRFGCWLRDV